MLQDFLVKVSAFTIEIFPYIGFVVPVLTSLFAPYVAFEQATSWRMRACSVGLVVLVLGLEIVNFCEDKSDRQEETERAEIEIQREDVVDQLLTMGLEKNSWTVEERTTLVGLFGRQYQRVVERFRMVSLRQEDLASFENQCVDSATAAALAIAGQVKVTGTEALCAGAVAETRTMLSQTEQAIAESTGSAASRIETTGDRVVKQWTEGSAELVQELNGTKEAVKKATASVGALQDQVVGLNTNLDGLRTTLVAPRSEDKEPGVLVRLRENLGDVDSDVNGLSSSELDNRRYRKCLARWFWPVSMKCASLIQDS